MKVCSKCKELKPLTSFGKDKRSSTGLRSQCKECEKIYNRRFEEKHREERNALRREYGKQYRETHKDIEKERQKRFRENRPDRAKEIHDNFYKNNPNARKNEYDRRLKRLGKSRRVVLTEEEKEIKRLEQKEKVRLKAHERYVKNFVSVEKVCRYCGKPFMTQYKKSKVFCCEDCSNKHSHYMSKLAEKRRKGKITALDRLDNDITLPLLFKRDKGVCKICGGLCDYNDIENRDGIIIVGDTLARPIPNLLEQKLRAEI